MVETRNRRGKTSESCDICGKNFINPASLRNHIDRIHGNKPFSCDSCDKKFVSKLAQAIHFKKIHTLDGKTRTLKSSNGPGNDQNRRKSTNDLNRRKSTGDLAYYRCAGCPKLFGNNENMMAHYNTIHLKIKDFSCKDCKLDFFTQSGMKSHFEKVH